MATFWASYFGLIISKFVISEVKINTESPSLARILMRIITVVLIALPILYIQSIPSFEDPLYFIFLLRTFLPSLLTGVILFGFSDYLFEKVESLFGLKPLRADD